MTAENVQNAVDVHRFMEIYGELTRPRWPCSPSAWGGRWM